MYNIQISKHAVYMLSYMSYSSCYTQLLSTFVDDEELSEYHKG